MEVFPTLLGVVFGVLYRIAQGDVATGNDAYHPRGVHAECRRYLTGIEYAQASAGTGTHIEYTSAATHTADYLDNEFFNLRYSFLNRKCHFLILGVYVMQNFAYRLFFKVVVKRGLLAYFYKCHKYIMCIV